mmetsp:Transcript_8049/g.12623  ORF Transcript_8049/g.12623 Transcript_8049/m.12623 type:complete len:456 (+) Transcript_8049:105-1472(+)
MDHQLFRRSSSSDGRGQPSRIQTFFRRNQNNKPKRILVSLFYATVASIYFYYLLSIDVGSGVDIRRKVDNNIKEEATSPIYKSNSKDPVKLQPRSLADVTIANVEVALKYHNDAVEMKRRQEMKKEERRRKKMELLKKQEEEASRKAAENQNADANAAVAVAANKGTILDSRNQTALLKEASLNMTTADLEAVLNKTAADLEYIQKLTSLQVNRTPTQRNRTKQKSTGSNNDDGVGGFLPFFTMIWICSICRLFFSRFMILSASSSRSRNSADDDDDEDIDRDASILLAMGGGRDAVQLRRRLRSARANRRFQRFVDRLNAERVENGERQISAETLRHLVNDRDFNGNDYDQLHSFADENGPALGSWFSQVGATDAEINRCPSRTLSAGDELLRPKRSQESSREETQSCSVCLETYQEGETVRTIPCFHTFHAKCIDPWLAEKAECPICKHSAIG